MNRPNVRPTKTAAASEVSQAQDATAAAHREPGPRGLPIVRPLDNYGKATITAVTTIDDPGERQRRLAELYRFFERPDAGRNGLLKQIGGAS